MLKAALPNETRHPRSLPPTIDLKDLIACKVWSSADYKPIAQKREKVMPPTPRLSLPLLQGNWTTTDWCRYTSDTGEEEGEEKSVWFSWRLLNGKASASNLRCPRQVKGLQQGSVNRWTWARERKRDTEAMRVHDKKTCWLHSKTKICLSTVTT